MNDQIKEFIEENIELIEEDKLYDAEASKFT